jgi:apolipoprotein N-acyltransferase
MMVLQSVIEVLKNFGFFDLYLPFVLTFAIFYGLLQKVKLFGETPQAERINVIIAFIASFYILIFSPVGITLADFFATFFGGAAVILVTILVFGAILTMSLITTKQKEEITIKYLQPMLIVFGASAAIILFITSGGPAIFGISVEGAPSVDINQVLGLIVILFFVGLVFYAIKEPEKK